MIGNLVDVGATAIVETKLRQESTTGVVTKDSLMEYWNFVLTPSTRLQYREQAEACLAAQAAELARLTIESMS